MRNCSIIYSGGMCKITLSPNSNEIDLGVLPFTTSTFGRINSTIKELAIADGAQRITNEMNVQFVNLISITLPASIKEISPSAFAGSSVRRISISNDSNSNTIISPIHCALSLLLNLTD